MIKPDIVVTWPRNCDYPLWREFVRENRSRFNEIIIAFTETHQGDDYREFVRESMFADYVHFVDAPLPTATEDWRNVAVRSSLLHSYNAKWVWFTEQDFYILGDEFWRDLDRAENTGADVIGVKQGDRLHPCCMFVKREILLKTKQNFGIVPDVSDHFSLFTKDLENAGAKIELLTDGYYHMNGLSHNFSLATRGEPVTYHPDEFIEYLEKCLLVKVEQSELFKGVAREFLAKTKTRLISHDRGVQGSGL